MIKMNKALFLSVILKYLNHSLLIINVLDTSRISKPSPFALTGWDGNLISLAYLLSLRLSPFHLYPAH